jgi:hypothetical protein
LPTDWQAWDWVIAMVAVLVAAGHLTAAASAFAGLVVVKRLTYNSKV